MIDVASLRSLIIGTLTVVLALVMSSHVVLHKRDPRAAVSWVGLIWLVPILGSVLYVLFGINRIRRRAEALRLMGTGWNGFETDSSSEWRVVTNKLSGDGGHLAGLARMVGRVAHRQLMPGNRIEPLVNGDEAYPAMLGAIDAAECTICLSTYIFDHDEVGECFAEALGRAVERGVAVRVLIDAFGSRYSWPSMVSALQKRNVPVARFMEAVVPWRIPFLNLRTHRKILVVDGRLGYTGGMNIRAGHVLKDSPRRPVQDLHFSVEGPVVEQLAQAFAEDWAFSTKEVLSGPNWFPGVVEVGPVLARGIVDGPDEDFDRLHLTLLAAVATAQRRVCVITPYFLPDRELISALNVASMRGVSVTIVLPSVNNQPLVKWASTAHLWRLLERGCRVFVTPPPFDHTKLMIVDGAWTLLGSANWDDRSLRLNFEFNLECYDAELAERLDRFVTIKLSDAREITKADVDARTLPVRLRDGAARLLSPYL
ncbi:MAG: phospholipase D-like domain-containing protein [Gemmatimonadales bacterium]